MNKLINDCNVKNILEGGQSGYRETSQETIIVFRMRADDSLDWDGNGEGGGNE